MEFKTWLEQSGRYAYRGIDIEEYPKILKHGLHPNWDMRKDAKTPAQLQALSNDPHIDPNKLYLFFADNEEAASRYNDGGVVRFPYPDDAVSHNQPGYFVTSKAISPQDIEIQVHYTNDFVPIHKAQMNPDGTVKALVA